MRSVLESIENRPGGKRKNCSELEDRNIEMTQVEEERKLRVNLKNVKSLRELFRSIGKSNILIGNQMEERGRSEQRAWSN